MFDLFWEGTVGGIVLEEVDVGLHVAKIVDGDNLAFGWVASTNGAENKTTDTAKSVDSNLNNH